MTAPAPIRHPAPACELRLQWPGKCWVWAQHKAHETDQHCTILEGELRHMSGWWVLRTRGPRPPWPEYIDQRETPEPESDAFITYTGPSEGFTTPAGGG